MRNVDHPYLYRRKVYFIHIIIIFLVHADNSRSFSHRIHEKRTTRAGL